jgi:GAF domain-containing protein
VDLGAGRTILAVPFRREKAFLGDIFIYRKEVRPFSDKQIALLENFAAQAVIAIENARLLTETREALEQQTATAEVLQVINTSPGDLAPVFDAILEKAHRLCEAPCGSLQLYDGQEFRAVADRGLAEPFAALLRRGYRPDANKQRARQFDPNQVIQFDMAQAAVEAPDDPMLRSAVEHARLRSVLAVPLRKDGKYLGRIVAGRQEVRQFTDKQIALLQNFAAQAVIAMENARLLTPRGPRTADRDCRGPGVINASPGNLVPVFDAILEKAHGLCGIDLGELEVHEDGKVRAVAVRGVSGPFADLLLQPFVPPPGSPPARLLAGDESVQVADVSELARDGLDDARAQAGAQAGLRTALFVPLRKRRRSAWVHHRLSPRDTAVLRPRRRAA